MNTYNLDKEDGEKIISFARDSINSYLKESQRMDVGSVDDVFNIRAGLLLQVRSTKRRNKIRGKASLFDGRRLSESLIESTIKAASPRSIGSKIRPNEINNVKLSISIIEEINITDNPVEDINIGTDCPLILNCNGEINCINPKFAKNQNWSPEEYLIRTCKKSNLNPNEWKNEDNMIMIAKTKTFTETNDLEDIKMIN